ncbi:platelet-derived growth factor beta polypeptide a [Eleginops maclovinus]
MAQQAACTIRTEVMEVTRAMVDRRNANFLVWPRCVEVQRCSGCCNSRTMQCVPVLTSSRYLQVLKIMFMNRKEHREMAIISVEDHVSCRCQNPSSSSSSQINRPPPPPPPLPPQQQQPPPPPPSSHLLHPQNPAPPKTHASKADLHRHDDLKHNQQQRLHLQQPGGGSRWQQGGYTQLVHWTAVPPPLGEASEARGEHSITTIRSGYDGSREEGRANKDQRPLHRLLNTPQSDAPAPPDRPTPSPRLQDKPTLPMTTSQEAVVVGGGVKDNGREESGSAISGGSGAAEMTKEKVLTGGGGLTEEERRQKVLEMIQTEPHLHPHLPQQRPKPTALRAALSTAHPPSARPPPPFRPASPRRRRKHRKRISKAAIRAMIM